MASNVFQINPYQLNQHTIPLTEVATIALPTTGVSAQNIINSPTRSLPTGVNVYSMALVLATGDKYYCRETFAQLVSLINA